MTLALQDLRVYLECCHSANVVFLWGYIWNCLLWWWREGFLIMSCRHKGANGGDNNQALLDFPVPIALPLPCVPVSWALEDNGRAMSLLEMSFINLRPKQKACFRNFRNNLYLAGCSEMLFWCCLVSFQCNKQGNLLLWGQFVFDINMFVL